VAIFRLAVADYCALSYGHDGPQRRRRVQPRHRSDAARFLQSRWAACLADQIGLQGNAVWKEARQLATASTDVQEEKVAA
jgi:hypothetical protein